MKSLYCLAFVMCIFFPLSGQTESVPERMREVVASYQEKASSNAALYNGKEHAKYPIYYKGHPFFISDKYASSALMFDGVYYSQVSLRLDFYTNELVVNTLDTRFNIILSPDRLEYAILHGYKIIYHVRDGRSNTPPTGYYAELYDGGYTVLRRQAVELQEKINGTQVEYSFNSVPRYYILKDGRYYTANSQSALLGVFKDKKRELKQFIRSNHLHYKTEPDKVIVEVVKQYEKIAR